MRERKVGKRKEEEKFFSLSHSHTKKKGMHYAVPPHIHSKALKTLKKTGAISGPGKIRNRDLFIRCEIFAFPFVILFFNCFFEMTETHVNKQQYERIPSLGERSGSIEEDNIRIEEDISIEKPTCFVYYLVFCVCIGGFLFGYDTGGKLFQQGSKRDKITKSIYYSYIWRTAANTKRFHHVYETERMDSGRNK